MNFKNTNTKYKTYAYVCVAVMLFACTMAGCLIFASGADIKLNKKSATLLVGETLQLKTYYAKGKITWSSDKKSVASVSANGLVKAKKAGVAVITAKCGRQKLQCRIYVRELQLSAKSLTVNYGSSKTLRLLYAKKKVSWFSGNKRIAYADGEKVYAKSVGTTKITAKCDGKSYVCKVKVVSGEDKALKEDGIYTSRDMVASYLHAFGRLPQNFITKKEANALGWNGGSLLDYAPYKCIGGDRFGNYEKTLPEESGRTYYECDIDTLGALERGAKRLVFSDDGLIYYTDDHYKSFTLLYGKE